MTALRNVFIELLFEIQIEGYCLETGDLAINGRLIKQSVLAANDWDVEVSYEYKE